MTRAELKRGAIRLIQTTRPSPLLITVALVAYDLLITYLSQRIGGQPFYIDMDAVAAMDMESALIVDWSNVNPVSSAFRLAFQVLSMLLSIGYVRYCLNAVRRQPAGFSDLMAGFEFPIRAIVLKILSQLVIGVLFALFIIPGLIALYAYAMAPKLLCDHPDWSPVRCMRESRRLMRGHKWEYFLLRLSFLGWILLTIIPVFSIFVNPYMELTASEYYLRLTGTETNGTDGTDASSDGDERPPWEY